MEAILKDLSAPSLAAATKANLYAFFRLFSRSPLTIFYEDSYLVRWHTRIAHPWFNGVLSTGPAFNSEGARIRETLSFFRSKGVASLTWWFEPDLSTEDWERHMLAHGFRYDASTPGMAVDLRALTNGSVPPELKITAVDDFDTLNLWNRTFMQGYGLPEAWEKDFLELITSLGLDFPVRNYLGFLDGQAVAASTLFLGVGVAGIYNVATLAAARGRGIGSAMTLAPLFDARRLGYQIGVLQSSEMGYGVYRRLGFQKVCNMDHYYWSAAEG